MSDPDVVTTLDAWYDMADEHWTAAKCEAMEAELMRYADLDRMSSMGHPPLVGLLSRAANMLQTQRLLLATAGPPPDPAAIDPEAVRRHIRAARFDHERKVYEIAFDDFVALIDTLDGREPKGDG